MRLLFVLLSCIILTCSQPQEIHSTNEDLVSEITRKLRVGAASAPINPSVGAFIAGDKQDRRFTGIHDSLYVKAVVFDDGENAMAIVTIDCIGLMYPDVQRIRQETAKISSFPVENIVVSSTHTHSGPDVVGLWGKNYQESGIDPEYMQFLIQITARQIVLADENKQSVTIYTGESEYGEGWVENICNEEIDRSVTVMQFRDDQGNSVASLTNFACHPTFMDASFTEVSADYVSGFYSRLDSVWGGENLFLQGAIGGWVQPVEGGGDMDAAISRGEGLAEVAMTSVKNSSPQESGGIEFRSKNIQLPVANVAWKQLAASGTIPREIQDSVTTEIAWFRIGTAQFATHPGETAPYFGLETKKLMTSGPRFILGLSQDALGYILKPSFFTDQTIPHSEYLTSMSVGPETGPRVMQALKEIVDKK